MNTNTIEGRRALREMELPDMPVMKTCREGCGRVCELQNAAEFFDVDVKLADGFKTTCKECRARKRQTKQIEERAANRSRVDKKILKLLKRMEFGGSDIPHIAEILANIMKLAGGPRGFAMMLMDTLVQAPPGSAVRQRILGQILNLSQAVTQTGTASISEDLLTDEELEKEFRRRLSLSKGEIIDAVPRIEEGGDEQK